MKVRRERGGAVCVACAGRLRDAWQFRRDLLRAEMDMASDKDGDGASHAVKVEWGAQGDDRRAGRDMDVSSLDGGSTDGWDASRELDIKISPKRKTERQAGSFSKLLDDKCLSTDKFSPVETEHKPNSKTTECLVQNEKMKEFDNKVNVQMKTKVKVNNFMKPTMTTIGIQKKRATKIFTPLSFKGITIKRKTYNLQPIRTSLENVKDEPACMAESNAALIIESSYVCPFKCMYNEYFCYYCNRAFHEPDQLREHTRNEHTTNTLRSILRSKKLTKIDVTEVNCKLCSEQINNVDALKEHLVRQHKKKFHAEVGDGVLPFLLTKDMLKCALCEERFSYFHSVNQHINEHFPNFVCETCGLGFVDQTRLQVHKIKHGRKESPCEKCGKSFRGLHALREHIERYHKRVGRIFCPVCPERFLSHEKKVTHLVQTHGRPPEAFKCSECEKDYPSRRALTLHKRREHLRDFRHECAYCARRFFTKTGLQNHTPTHTGERRHRCEACGKSFPRRKALTEHARTHGERQFVCTVCGHVFVQMNGLRLHLRTQHPHCEYDEKT